MQEEMESMMSNSVNIKRAQQDIERLLNGGRGEIKGQAKGGKQMEVISVIVMFIFGNMNDQEHQNDTVCSNGITVLMHEGSAITQEKGNGLYKGRILWTGVGGIK